MFCNGCFSGKKNSLFKPLCRQVENENGEIVDDVLVCLGLLDRRWRAKSAVSEERR